MRIRIRRVICRGVVSFERVTMGEGVFGAAYLAATALVVVVLGVQSAVARAHGSVDQEAVADGFNSLGASPLGSPIVQTFIPSETSG